VIRQYATVALVVLTTTACGGQKASPTAPSGLSTTSSSAAAVGLSITPLSKTVFVGETAVLEARETLADGATRVATNVRWSSDNANIASVSATGLITATGPGEATLTAETAVRGALVVRVYPNFSGRWRGLEIVDRCSDTEDLNGLCTELEFVGETFLHDALFLQTDASIDASMDLGDGQTARAIGTVTVDGEAQIGSAVAVPGDPEIAIGIRNWRIRANQPGQMTGSYEMVLSVPGLRGEITLGMRLQDVIRTSITPLQLRRPTGGAGGKVRELTRAILTRR
jgi:hypothetical protein